MIKNIGLGLIVIVVVLVAILLLTLGAAVIPLGTAWLLLFITPLTFFEASLLNSSILMLLIFASQRDGDFDLISMAIHLFVLMPAISMILNLVTWILHRFISLSYSETLLVTSLTTLPILYALYVSFSVESAITGEQNGEDEDEDENEEEDDYDYDEDDEYDYDYLIPKIRPKKKKRNQPTPEEIIEQLKKSSLRSNDPCYCGSGKKYRRCHGRKSWR